MSNAKGRFGIHGGQYIPETLMNAVIELEEAYNHYKDDPQFQAELTELLNEYAGRPSRLYYAEKMRISKSRIIVIAREAGAVYKVGNSARTWYCYSGLQILANVSHYRQRRVG